MRDVVASLPVAEFSNHILKTMFGSRDLRIDATIQNATWPNPVHVPSVCKGAAIDDTHTANLCPVSVTSLLCHSGSQACELTPIPPHATP